MKQLLSKQELFDMAADYFGSIWDEVEIPTGLYQTEDIINLTTLEITPFEEARKLFWNEEEECLKGDIFNETMDKFAIFCGEKYENYGYSEEDDMVYFLKKEDFETVSNAWYASIGAALYQYIELEYKATLHFYMMATGYNASH